MCIDIYIQILHTNIAYILYGAGTRSVILTRPCVVAAFVNSRAFFAGHDAIPPECICHQYSYRKTIHTDTQTDTHTHRQTNRQTDRHTDTHTQRQTHRHTLAAWIRQCRNGSKICPRQPLLGRICLCISGCNMHRQDKEDTEDFAFVYLLARFCLCRFTSKV